MVITGSSSVEDVLTADPALTKVFIESGLPCLVCGQPFWGTIEELAKQYNVNPEKLVNKLNEQKRESNEKL